MEFVCACMWNLDKAADQTSRFSGYIPCSNETLIDFIEEYKRSDLYLYHQDFDQQSDLPAGSAAAAARKAANVGDVTRATLTNPNPAALQPKRMRQLVNDFLIEDGWQPRHIANILRDLYATESYGWSQDFSRYPIEEKSNFWVRTYGAMALWQKGQLRIALDG